MVASHINLAATLVDRLYRDGMISRHSAEWLFDVVADALAPHSDMSAVIVSEIEFAHQAFLASINTGELWSALELSPEEKK